jgi:hypothetical protein
MNRFTGSTVGNPEDIEKIIKKLQESGEEQRIFEEKCKKSMLREYYINLTEKEEFILR